MSRLHRQIVETCLRDMVDRGWFSVCEFDKCVRLLKVCVPDETRHALAPLHCVDFGKMPPDVRDYVLETCAQLFDLPVLVLRGGKLVNVTPEPAHRGRLRRLLTGTP